MVSSFTINAQHKPLDNWDLETLSKGQLQNEAYFSFSKRGEFKSFAANPVIRYGMMQNLELQLGWKGTRVETATEEEADQVARVGLKAYLSNDSKYLPGISLIGSMNLTTSPTDTPFALGLNALFRKGITSNFTLTGNYQLIFDEEHSDWSNDFAINLDVLVTDWLTSYVGVKGVKSFPVPNETPLHQEYVEFGMLIWVADGFRLYPYYDLGLGDDTNDIFSLGAILLFH